MLVRAFRVTDRLGNAFLRLGGWAALTVTDQTTILKNWLIGLLVGFYRATTGAATAAATTARVTTRTAQRAAEAVETRRSDLMAQRAAEAELKPTVREDPLKAQNRALSAFAVLLLIALLAVLVIQTTGKDDTTTITGQRGNLLGANNGSPVATALFPTATPTPTPIPDPLRVGGSLVYSLRENGQEDLWAISVGQSNPLRLTNDPADDRDPAWSPDGTRIAFSSNRDGNWDLYILEIATGATTRLTGTPGFEGAPTWSPDGAWIAYEGYYPDSQDLDIYYISADPARAANEGAGRITYTPGPDIEPDWGPGSGRDIAFSSWRSGTNQDIYIVSLDIGDGGAVNLTNTPDINENYPDWDNLGATIAYSASVEGVEGVYIKPVQQSTGEVLVGRGHMPAWAPNGASIAYTLDTARHSQILAKAPGSFGGATDTIELDYHASDPDWTPAPLPTGLLTGGGVPPSVETLYTEITNPKSDGRYGMASLNNVVAPQPYLSDAVNDSFEALRLRVLEKTGYDFLGTLEDAFWKDDRPIEPGEPQQNWHYTGRAFAINRDLIYVGFPTAIEVVREEVEVSVYWRVYVRVVDGAQDGALGEPLRYLPWDFEARGSGDVQDYQSGGKLKNAAPPGYYVDLTQLADDFGWLRQPAERTWQYNFGAIQYWEFVKSDGLSWQSAMLQLYSSEEFEAIQSESTTVPPPPALPTDTATPEVFRTATPLPPDQQ
ncbi:MAG TPA: DPP IV N-terminal domain-containing protein [Aggregatilineaceae bacterium]|nr:DPP IV N-terminal domain-containing protein [Aggregatilineaceae bacterium]